MYLIVNFIFVLVVCLYVISIDFFIHFVTTILSNLYLFAFYLFLFYLIFIVSIFLRVVVGKRDLAVDVGTGTGQAAVPLAKYFKNVIGFDPSEGQVANATTAGINKL